MRHHIYVQRELKILQEEGFTDKQLRIIVRYLEKLTPEQMKHSRTSKTERYRKLHERRYNSIYDPN